MIMDPITPATTPPLSSPVEPISCLDQGHSLASVRPVLTLSVCSASASDKARPISTARCPHCCGTVTMSDLAGVMHRDSSEVTSATKAGELTPLETPLTPTKGNLKLQTSGPGFDSLVVSGVNPTTVGLLKTLQDINNEIQVHCQDLHQIRLMCPSPAPSRRGSVHSVNPLESGATLSTSSGPISKENNSTLTNDSSIENSNRTLQVQGHGFQSGHPLICDLDDLVNLSGANFRLLKTLQDKVNKVDLVEKMLRTEREAVEREKKQLKQMSAEVEKERVRLMAGGLGWDNYRMDTSHNQSGVISRNISGGATPDGIWDEVTEATIFDEEWTEEKEQYLAQLEHKLKKANRQWSDEQEEILGPLERLREEKRQEEKAKRLERQTSNKFERVNSREDQSEKALRKKSGDGGRSPPRSSSFKNSLSNIRRNSSVSSLARRDSSPSGSTTPTKLFRKWFP